MAEVRIHEATLTRVPFDAPEPAVRVHQATLTRVPPAGDPPVVRIHAAFVTRGFELPQGDGALYARINDTWVPYEIVPRENGAWP